MSAYDKNKFVDAIKDKLPGEPEHRDTAADQPGPGSTPQEVAEKARRDEEARISDQTREERLIKVGRADQTTGR